VVVTHDQAVASRMHREVRMLDGRIVSDTASPPDRAAAASHAATAPTAWDGGQR
jgi:ABC-type lipoprotein export system ATPase subunit